MAFKSEEFHRFFESPESRGPNVPGKLRFVVLALGAYFFVAGIVRAQDPQSSSARGDVYREQIHSLAGRLLKRTEKAKCRASCTILVENFTMPSGSTSHLGIQLADSVAAELTAQGRGIQIVDRSRLQDYLVREHIPSAALKDREAARWLATELHANVALVGRIERVGDRYNLLTELLNISNDKVGPQEAMEIAIPEPEEAFARFEPYDAERPGQKAPAGAPPFVRAGEGGSIPSCIYCPAPQYSEAARKVKFAGTVILDVTVAEDGRATDIRVLKGVPFGLNEQAIRAVNEWTFKPASSGDRPVAVRVPIETSFRLY
jgi:TonB family protein